MIYPVDRMWRQLPAALPIRLSDDYIESNPNFPGGLLTSKPTRSNALGCSAASAFFVLACCPMKNF
jgi:hypothetical protein